MTPSLHLAFVCLAPLKRLFQTEPPDATDRVLAGAVALAGFFVISLEKWVWRLKRASKATRGGPIPEGTRT